MKSNGKPELSAHRNGMMVTGTDRNAMASIANGDNNTAPKAKKEKTVDKMEESINQKVEDLTTKRKVVDIIHGIILLGGLFFGYLAGEFLDLETETVPDISQVFRTINLGSTAFLLFFVWTHYSISLDILKVKKFVYYKTTIFTSPLATKFYVECFVNVIHMPPGPFLAFGSVTNGVEYKIPADSYIATIMMLRLYIMLRIFQNHTEYTNKQAVRFCKMNGFIPDSSFALKCYMRTMPFFFLGLASVATIIVFGLIVKKYESPFPTDKVPSFFPFDSIWNSWWCMILTMTTVGYGDIFPLTILGRVFTIVACLVGVFVVSTLISKLAEVTQLNDDESAAYDAIIELDTEKEVIKTKLKLAGYVVSYLNSVRKKMPFSERYKRYMLFKNFKQKLDYEKLLVDNFDPQLNDGVELLSSLTRGFYNKSEQELKSLRELLIFDISHRDKSKEATLSSGRDTNTPNGEIENIRNNQIQIDKKAAELYSVILKTTSYICMNNKMGKAPEMKTLDRLKVYYSAEGAKNKEVKVSEYLQRFMDSRKELIGFAYNWKRFTTKFDAKYKKRNALEPTKLAKPMGTTRR